MGWVVGGVRGDGKRRGWGGGAGLCIMRGCGMRGKGCYEGVSRGCIERVCYEGVSRGCVKRESNLG